MMGTRHGMLAHYWAVGSIVLGTTAALGQMPILEQPQQLPIETSACGDIAQAVPFAADWDNDGKKDLLVGEMKAAKVRLFLNTGTDTEPLFLEYEYLQAGGSTLRAGFACAHRSYPQVLDWNNDGEKDLISGTTTGYVILFLNTSDVSQPALQKATRVKYGVADINVGWEAAPCLTDWNGDGKKDLLVGCEAGTISLFLNVNSDEQPDFGPPSYVQAGGKTLVAEGGLSSPKHVDWDGDGVRDLLVGCSAGKVFFYKNQGTDTNPNLAAGEPLTTGEEVVDIGEDSCIDVVDWNNNGAFDLLVGGRSGWMYVVKRSPPVDADEDGLPDEFEETIVAFDPADAIDAITDVFANDDLDGDGQTNRDEYIAGTDPTDPHDLSRVTANIIPDTGEFLLSWPTRSGRTYQVLWYNEELNAWQPVQWPVIQRAFGGRLSFRDHGINTIGDGDDSPGAPGVARRFYMIRTW